MGRIVNPETMKAQMKSIKSNVNSYSVQYSEAEARLDEYSQTSASIKGNTANAIINQLSCYKALINMFYTVADNISKDCDTVIASVGDEYLNEDEINSKIDAQNRLIKRCDERIEDYRHKMLNFPFLLEYCEAQIQINHLIKGKAKIVIFINNKKLEKLDEIESCTNELFLAEKAVLDQINGCIAELKKSGAGGFTFQNLPAWATAINDALLEKYRKDMLTDGRLKEDFVIKYSDLTYEKMTPAEKAAYREYVNFLMLEAAPEDMNLVIKHSYRKTMDGVMAPKDSALELAYIMGVATRTYSATQPKDIDSSILERCTIMGVALTRYDTFKTGKISLVDGHYKYEYEKYRRSLASKQIVYLSSTESYTTSDVSETPTDNADKLTDAKVEYLKNLMRKDASDYVLEITEFAVGIGLGKVHPGIGIAYDVTTLALDMLDSPGKNEDFGIKSEGVANMAQHLRVRVSIATSESRRTPPYYTVYPTGKTEEMLEFYNEVFKAKDFDPIKRGEIWNNPEEVSERFGKLGEKLKKVPYTYNDKSCDSVEDLYEEYIRNSK